MSQRLTRLACLVAVGLSAGLCGCGEGKEKTVVQLHYRLAPTKQLPPGMKTLAVLPAETTDEADAKWSELASNMVQGLLAQANDQFACTRVNEPSAAMESSRSSIGPRSSSRD